MLIFSVRVHGKIICWWFIMKMLMYIYQIKYRTSHHMHCIQYDTNRNAYRSIVRLPSLLYSLQYERSLVQYFIPQNKDMHVITRRKFHTRYYNARTIAVIHTEIVRKIQLDMYKITTYDVRFCDSSLNWILECDHNKI